MSIDKLSRITVKSFRTVRQYGLRNALWRLALGLFKYNKFVVFERGLLEEWQWVKAKVPIEIKSGTLGELRFVRSQSTPLPMEFFMDEIDGVNVYFLAYIGGELAGICWIYFAGDPNRFIELKEKEAELKYSYTFEKFRGRSIYPELANRMCHWLKEKGYEKVFGFVHATNLPNIKGTQKAGLNIVGTLTQIGPFRPKYKSFQ